MTAVVFTVVIIWAALAIAGLLLWRTRSVLTGGYEGKHRR